ncbi:MAG TPA: thiamine pyrophosphate-dependent enzyme [Micromonosporaceae bacterium]|nr:thiamine pyrophosphate-dependent enzyme [Micromonosporaceae bacterium]
MTRTAAIQAIIDATVEEPIIFAAGEPARIARRIADRPNHFYLTGSSGLVSSVGIGVALETRRPTVVVDGNGSLLTNPGGLITAGLLTDLPLVHVVLDTAMQTAGGGTMMLSRRVDLCGLAQAAGYPHVYSTGTLDEFAGLVRSQIAVCTSPVFIRVVLAEDDEVTPVRLGADLEQHARRFYDHVSAPEWLAGAA